MKQQWTVQWTEYIIKSNLYVQRNLEKMQRHKQKKTFQINLLRSVALFEPAFEESECDNSLRASSGDYQMNAKLPAHLFPIHSTGDWSRGAPSPRCLISSTPNLFTILGDNSQHNWIFRTI